MMSKYHLARDLTILDVCSGFRCCLAEEKIYDEFDAYCQECKKDAKDAMLELEEKARRSKNRPVE
jgi:hypothetical protein